MFVRYYEVSGGNSSEMSTRREYPCEMCLFGTMRFPGDIALKNQHIFYVWWLGNERQESQVFSLHKEVTFVVE